jgi:hypothetical protein
MMSRGRTVIDYNDLNAAWSLFADAGLWVQMRYEPDVEPERRFRVECFDADGVTGIGHSQTLGYAMENAKVNYDYRRQVHDGASDLRPW